MEGQNTHLASIFFSQPELEILLLSLCILFIIIIFLFWRFKERKKEKKIKAIIFLNDLLCVFIYLDLSFENSSGYLHFTSFFWQCLSRLD